MAEDFQSKQLFEEISKTIDVIGTEKLIQVLQNERSSVLKAEDPLVNFVFRMVADNIGMTIEELINSRKNTPRRKFGIGFLVYYLYYNCNISIGAMQTTLKKKKSVLSARKIQIQDLSDEIKSHRYWIEKKKYFDTAISNYQISNK
jgi:hypothetical protein